MSGYTGKILRLNLTSRESATINTADYEGWVGGHGMGSAIFWDLVPDKAIDGFDPRNVVTIMTSPLSGTLVPAASGRTEVQGIGVQSYPIGWFTRSNFGGRFGAMLKFAGWDGIVIEGKAEQPVWIDVRNDDVAIKDARGLWGLDTWQAQQEIWGEVLGGDPSDGWMPLGEGDGGSRTTQRPAVLTIGPAGENLSRTACLIHDAGNSAGQGGFGGVWGSKNLKAISVIGSGSIQIADPNGLMESRQWAQKWYGLHVDHRFGDRKPQMLVWDRPEGARPQACFGCHEGCRERYGTGLGNESSCVVTDFYTEFDKRKHGRQTEAAYIGADLLQKYGINAFEAWRGLEYLEGLSRKGILGPGKEIDCDLPFEQLGEVEFAEKFLHMIAHREGIGDDLAEGFVRAAERWGRLEEDLETGLLRFSYWGLPTHSYDPRADVSWGYGSILGDRDINEHGLTFGLFFWASSPKWARKEPPAPAEVIVKLFAEKLTPFEGDPLMLDYSSDNIYSHHMAKLVAWHRYYTRFWKQSALFCDLRWPMFFSGETSDHRGITGEGESRFLNAVTGKNYSFRDGVEIGRKIWNLDNAIWTLQGRHRDMVHFAEHIYKVPYSGLDYPSYHLPGRRDGAWDYIQVNGRSLDRDKFEAFKTAYYDLEGWDVSSGWPTRNTLEDLGLGQVADELEGEGRLGG